MSDQQVTTNELMDFLQDNMATKEELKLEIGSIKEEMGTMRGELDRKLNQQTLDLIDRIDDKLADLKADLIMLLRKGDRKFVALINTLVQKDILQKEDVEKILAMEPFPR